MYYAEHSTDVTSVQHHIKPIREILLLHLFYGWENWGLEKLSNSKSTQWLRSGTEIQNCLCLIPKETFSLSILYVLWRPFKMWKTNFVDTNFYLFNLLYLENTDVTEEF